MTDQLPNITTTRLDKVSAAIEAMWPSLVRTNPTTGEKVFEYLVNDQTHTQTLTLLGLPNPYLIPANHVFEMQFYWDSYFTMVGLSVENYRDMIVGIVENFFHMVKEYGHIPNASATLWLNNNSQPPYLSSMMRLAYEQCLNKDKSWLSNYLPVLEKEYQFWMSELHHGTAGLQRYHSQDDTIFWTEAESGWDFTPRFGDARNCLPIDLNALLFKYEMDLAWFYEEIEQPQAAEKWLALAGKRKLQVDLLLWDEEQGFYFDYDFVIQQRRPVWSLAAYAALWAGMADAHQAECLVKHLARFEGPYGLATCDQPYQNLASLLETEEGILPNQNKQWNWPNGWAPIEWTAIDGLSRYGYQEQARRLAVKWLAVITENFEQTGKIWEKYNVMDGTINVVGRYGNHPGFGWTNASFQAIRRKFEI